MINIEKFKNTWFFKEKLLKNNEVLFDEGELDTNIYIVESWELVVEKYTTNKKDETKLLNKLSSKEVFWEAALNNNLPKQVKIRATMETKLLTIDAKEWISELFKKHPVEWLELLKYIIFLSNQRLLRSNYLLTTSYKINNEIQNLENISNREIFKLIDELKDIANVDYILYYEHNNIVDDYITFRYDTREEWKIHSKVLEVTEFEIQEKNIYTFTQKLSIWSSNMWYLVFCRMDSDFDDNDKKALINSSTSIAWVIKQKQIFDEQKNESYIQD